MCPEEYSGIVRPVRSTVPDIYPRAILLGHAAGLFLKAFSSKSTEDNVIKTYHRDHNGPGGILGCSDFENFEYGNFL